MTNTQLIYSTRCLDKCVCMGMVVQLKPRSVTRELIEFRRTDNRWCFSTSPPSPLPCTGAAQMWLLVSSQPLVPQTDTRRRRGGVLLGNVRVQPSKIATTILPHSPVFRCFLCAEPYISPTEIRGGQQPTCPHPCSRVYAQAHQNTFICTTW